MRALVHDGSYGIPAVLPVREVPVPVSGDDEVLIRVHAAGVDPSVWHLMTGLPYLVRAAYGMRRSKIREWGWDVSGVIEAAGANVREFRAGDAVCGTIKGAYAEFARTTADRIVPKPARISFGEAAALGISGCTALQALRDVARVERGQRVMIIGAGGGVGTFAVQIAKALGACVTGVCSASKVEMVRSLGAEHVIDYTRDDCVNGVQRYDVIVDTAGVRPLGSLRRALTPRGTLVMVGGESRGRVLGGLGRVLRATMLSPFVSQSLRGMLAKASKPDLLALKRFVDAGQLTPVIDRVYSLEHVADALRYLEQGHTQGKIVVEVAAA
jgi:NADPH:quinone reductase-like Zn-dependent oxidoreductase